MGCRTRRLQAELVRVAVDGDGGLVLSRTAPGRGAWLCADHAASCCALAARRKAFGRALRREVAAAAVEALHARVREPATLEGFAPSTDL